MARTLGNIKKHHYRILHRTPASFAIPETEGQFTTFMNTFTELGYCRDKTLQSTLDPSDVEVLDDGTDLIMDYKGHLEGILLQAEIVDYTAYEAIDGVPQDILLYSETTEKCIIYLIAKLYFQEAVISGETETVPFTYDKKNIVVKTAFRIRFDEPET